VKHLGQKGFSGAFLFLFVLAAPAWAKMGEETDISLTRRHLSPWGAERLLKAQGSGTFIQFSALPVQGKISSLFGPRRSPRRGASRLHKGIDISAPRGTPVKAVAPGVVVFKGRDKAYGNTVVLDHGDGLTTRYAHLDSYAVDKGARVGAGQTLGTVGRTGRATGCNLHFETVLGGVPMDPLTASLWHASLPKLEMLPRLFAARGKGRSFAGTRASAPAAKRKASPTSAAEIRKGRAIAPLAGVNSLSQSRVSPPPRGDLLP
jgi:murein DD-endopeptidase MepM/ murein hydrolase activator NlpD